ncbi:hypothetical protein DDB_G0288023 [Dictyostelium discoideum AX4]|uniref:Uncharacterized protein n=1 Tax=Dictyostelium discoideum TaxID=44689 RepID=Q54JI8_DICDI|nr:hypothetical protein DDB_G0288023 [Dictyostelium discoideum AX4]EAL63437.1 hypothetical protein DDB_G0288023 [Dictyostelium discoideum AX4]|eukprot:XP_636943.1 hypothetical protein DDB_G0288023 [Dictyostelium discoideum AX4]
MTDTSKLFKSNNIFYKKFDGLDYAAHTVFSRGGYFFKGEIDLEKFLKSMEQVFDEFPVLLSTFHSENGIWCISYPPKSHHKVNDQLEIENRENELIETTTLESIIPMKLLDERMKNGFSFDLEGLPMGSFKLTILKDGFVIGYSINHSLFDQSSMYYFFKYLSMIYSNNGENEKVTLKKPIIINGQDFYDRDQPSLTDLQNFRDYGKQFLGYTYTPFGSSSGDDTSSEKPKIENITIKVNFNLIEIENLIKSIITDCYLSTNDIIHSIIIKILSMNESISDDEEFRLRYTCNMRKRCNLSEEHIGNFGFQQNLLFKVSDIKNKSILELAKINRKDVSEFTNDNFFKTITWHNKMQTLKELPLNYLGKQVPTITNISNWTSFDYNKISFDGIKPFTIKAPCIASYNVNIICFDYDFKNDKKFFRTTIYIPSNSFNQINNFSNDSKLFTIEKS